MFPRRSRILSKFALRKLKTDLFSADGSTSGVHAKVHDRNMAFVALRRWQQRKFGKITVNNSGTFVKTVSNTLLLMFL